MSATIRIENEIAIITMDDGKANAINPTMLDALNAALDQAEKEAKAVIITGRPDRFSGGFDLKMMMGATPEDVRALVNAGGALALRLFTLPMPVIAACTGHGIAMGCFILLSCDKRFGAKGAYKIGANETQIGMVLPVFALELCKARLNPLYMTESVVNGTLFDPDEAVSVGYLDKAVAPDQVMAEALAEAERLKALPGAALAGNKRILRKPVVDVIGASLAQ
ncbi:crotonase/enoyl-CoA hydratase family protein [Hyphomonas johnsonii]|jgi:enoyl-CoA hydratase|uniref:Enoyl-CoA hydratase/isomerase family protein n=1 Tax=Hyphomonas johnsonii MHS-2 TaxID=1280950 RepID=A0A059FJL2_9PROT|nr:crotonase/enoyl-CoA hydratase family protein [Hyphomonas johnsonii]KCZ90850.1 enoyl-CoA hydratase/isomerase family protein [Hyphomonas johnsonii MHS-2]